jgi:hypothetical protein
VKLPELAFRAPAARQPCAAGPDASLRTSSSERVHVGVEPLQRAARAVPARAVSALRAVVGQARPRSAHRSRRLSQRRPCCIARARARAPRSGTWTPSCDLSWGMGCGPTDSCGEFVNCGNGAARRRHQRARQTSSGKLCKLLMTGGAPTTYQSALDPRAAEP